MPSSTYNKGNETIISSNPKGHMMEVLISGTPKPGTVMEIVPSIEPDANGHHTYRAWSKADGASGVIAVLTNQLGCMIGMTMADARASGTLETVYFPEDGEELNMLIRDQPGTGTANVSNVGDRLGVDQGSGMLQAIGSGTFAPFELATHLGIDQTANFHAWCRYRGSQPGIL